MKEVYEVKDAELIHRISNEKVIIIFGAGDRGIYLYHMLAKRTESIQIYVCDNARQKQGSSEIGEVISVEKAVESYPQGMFLLASAIQEDTMRKQLLSLGVCSQKIYGAVTEEAEAFFYKRKAEKKLTPLEMLQFEINITEHCNLNCKCCSQFSPIAEKEYIDLETMERDFRRLGQLFEGRAKRIYLIGGEPLLHPQIVRCMKIAREYFPMGKISVFTNGLLLLKCRKKFWDACRDNEITIIVTKYPIKFDYDLIQQKAMDENVAFEFFGTSEDFKYMINLGIDVEGKQDKEKNFVSCGEANNCIKLRNGKLYTCTRPTAIYKFNKFFHKNLEVREEDYIDIFQVSSGQEILEKLAHPIPFCRYCDKCSNRKAMLWGTTEKRIEEWL